jgi:hypothetical protein
MSRVLRLALCSLFLTPYLAAQFSGAIQGTVVDSTQASVPAAVVTARNVDTGIVREVPTSNEGFYRISNLAPGTYNVRAEKAGFSAAQLEGLVVDITKVVKADFTMAVGAIAEQVSVQAKAPVIETEQGRISGQVDRIQLSELPLNGRNAFNLIALQPGMMGRGQSVSLGSQGGGNDSFAGETGVQIYASGQDSSANSFTVDDTSVNSVAYGGAVNTVPNAESIEEVRVTSNNFSAEEGRNPGARIQVITRQGTNTFHGTLSYYNQNGALTARNVFATTVPNVRKNQYGYSVGGPIIKNRTFFFTTFEGLRQSGAPAQVYTVETAAFRDFVVAKYPNTIAANLLTHFQPAVYPTTGLRDLGSPLPSGGPLGAGPADGIFDIGNVSFAPNFFRRAAQFSVRLDHELRPGKDKLYGSFYRTGLTSQAGGIRPDFDRPLDEWTYFGNLTEIHIFSPNKVNEFRGGVSQLNGNPWDAAHLEIPKINITGVSVGYPISSDGTITNVPGGWWQTNYDFRDVFTWVRSTHTLKIGAEVRMDVGANGWSSNYIPTYQFNSILDFAVDLPLQETRQVDPRTGAPAVSFNHRHNIETGFFVQDDWKVTRHLTLNIGLREENFGRWTYKQPHRTFLLGPGSNIFQQVASGSVQFVDQLAPNRNFDWGPRLGFAWDPTGKGTMAVRGGYGMSFDRASAILGAEVYISPATVNLGPQLGNSFVYSLGSTACKGDGRQGGVGSCPPYLGYPVDAAAQAGLNPVGGINGARISVSGTDAGATSPYVHNWFLGVQREIARNTVLELNYLGSAGHHLSSGQNYNRYTGDLVQHNGVFTGLNPYFGSVSIAQTGANSIFSGGTIVVRRAFSRGLNLQGSYTFGRAISDTSTLMDVTNRRLDRGLTSFDTAQKLVIVGVWAMPFFKGKSWSYRVLGGWELSGSTILQSGTPLTVGCSGSYPKCDYNADGAGGDRPNAPLTQLQTSGWSRQQLLTGILPATAFPTPALGTDGNLGIGTYRGPGFAETDLSLSKKFVITERFSAKLQMDAYNAFNRVNLNNPALTLNTSTFGQSTTALTPRVYQAGLKIQF